MGNTVRLWILILFVANMHAQCHWRLANNSGFMASGIQTDGTLWVWGSITSADVNNYSAFPVQVGTDSDWKSVSTAYSNRAAIKNNGTLWTWGSRSGGHLGDGFTGLGNNFVYQPTQVGTDTDWKSVDCNSAGHTLAIKENGTLWVWGVGYSGAFGFPYSSAYLGIPTQIGTDSDWKFATVGFSGIGSPGYFDSTSMAIKNDGSLWGWGSNEGGHLGVSSPSDLNIPTLISSISNVAYVTTSNQRTFAIKSDGTLWACGYNSAEGILGDGTTITRTSFIQIGTDNNWKSVNVGKKHALATKTDGTLWAWGSNENGALGTGNNINSSIPIQIGSETDWVSVSANQYSSLALKTDGSMYAWGANAYLSLGIGLPQNYVVRNYPSLIGCNGLGTDNYESENINIYPNPVKETLSFELNQNTNVKKLIIYDLLGKKIIEQTDNISKQISVGQLNPGIYLVQFYIDENVYQQKFIKE